MGTGVSTPLALTVNVAESVVLVATISAEPVPRSPLKPWAVMVSRVSLKVQVIVRSDITHSPTVWLEPWWVTVIGSLRFSLLRICSGSPISKESPLLAPALLASQANFSLRMLLIWTEVLFGSSLPLGSETTSDRSETVIFGLLAARACVGRTVSIVATIATSRRRAPAARAGAPRALGIGISDTGSLSGDL